MCVAFHSCYALCHKKLYMLYISSFMPLNHCRRRVLSEIIKRAPHQYLNGKSCEKHMTFLWLFHCCNLRNLSFLITDLVLLSALNLLPQAEMRATSRNAFYQTSHILSSHKQCHTTFLTYAIEFANISLWEPILLSQLIKYATLEMVML